MTAGPDRSQLASDAERAVRRGELKEALRLYRRLLECDPEDRGLRARIATIESLLQPSELAGRDVAPIIPAASFDRPPTAEQQAERLFESGDYAGALSAYEQILETRPGHQLAGERIQELRDLVAAFAPRPVTPMPLQDRAGVLEGLLSRIGQRRKT
jgi:tetratricopeptide (TPR) repeat protein